MNRPRSHHRLSLRHVVSGIATCGALLWNGSLPLFAAASDGLTLTIQLADQFPPKAVTNLAGASPAEQQINMTWTAPFEDDLPAPSYSAVKVYDIRRATFSVVNGDTTTWWNTATALLGEPAVPAGPGTTESMFLNGLKPGSTHYFGLKSEDEVPNISKIDELSLSSSTQLKVVVMDVPPPAPANPIASPGNSQVTVQWDPVMVSDLDHYNVYCDSVTPYDFSTPTVFWVSGATNTFTHTSLTNGVTYYYYVTAVDEGLPVSIPLESPPSNTVFAKATANAPPEAPTLSVDLLSLTTSQIRWILTDNALEEDELYVTQSTNPGGRISPDYGRLPLVGSSVTFTETSLVPNRKYTRYGEAYNTNGSSWSVPVGIFTLANPPINSRVIAVTSATVTLAWDSNSNNDPTFYEVEYDRDNSFDDPTSAGGTVSLNFTVFGLDSNATYWFRVRARNEDNIYTLYDTTVSTKTTKPKDTVPPKAPHPITVNWEEPGGEAPGGDFAVRINWRDVTRNVDGTKFDDPAPEQYRIYRSKSFRMDTNNPAEKVWNMKSSSVQTSGGSLSTTLDVLGSRDTYYYRLRAVDEWGNESPDSMVIEAKGDGTILNVLAEGDDKISQLSLPAQVANSLMKENNAYGDDLTIKLVPTVEEEKGRVVRSVRFDFYEVETGAKINQFLLPQAGVVKVGFLVDNGFVIQGAPSAGSSLAPSRAPVMEEKKARESLSMFWHNGVEWVKVGGAVDPSRRTVELKTRRTGRYQVRQAIHIGPVSLTKVYPRIITPNDDGWNDKVMFEFDNPALVVLNGEIFDVTGAKVSDLVPGPSPETTLMWDGKRSGTPVPSGIYIYQIEAGGETATGTVVVAE